MVLEDILILWFFTTKTNLGVKAICPDVHILQLSQNNLIPVELYVHMSELHMYEHMQQANTSDNNQTSKLLQQPKTHQVR